MIIKRIVLPTILAIAIGYPLIVILTSIISTYSGEGSVNATIYNTGITAAVLAISLFCAVVGVCTILILQAISNLLDVKKL